MWALQGLSLPPWLSNQVTFFFPPLSFRDTLCVGGRGGQARGTGSEAEPTEPTQTMGLRSGGAQTERRDSLRPAQRPSSAGLDPASHSRCPRS